MKLVENWKRVVSISLSFWMQVIGLLILIIPEAWYAITGRDYDPRLAWTLGVFFLLVLWRAAPAAWATAVATVPSPSQ